MPDPIIPPIGYPSPGVPPIDVGNTGNDARQRILEALRKKVRGTQVESLKTYEEKKEEMDAQILSQGKADLFDEIALVYPGEGIEKKPANTNHYLMLMNLESLETFQFQFVPRELEYNTTSNFQAIATMGRNIPVYHYTGGEDTLSFEIDWFAQTVSRRDTLERCKQIEALSKNDGYNKPPPRVKLLWGDMFNEAIWLVQSAPYRLSLPHKDKDYFTQQAYQKVTLIRISEENPLWSDILNISR